MKFYRPTIIKRITQKFGQNLNNFYSQLGLLGHNGIDYGCPAGTELRCPTFNRSYVILANDHPSYGKRVVLLNQDPDTQKWYKLYFGHLKSYEVNTGDYVDTGDLLGHTNNTGKYTTGPHLHFGLYETDAGGHIKNYGNGYEGAIDPNLSLIDQYVLEALINMQQQVSIIKKIIEAMKALLKLRK